MIEVGDQVYKTVPFTQDLVKKITDIQDQVKAGAMDAMAAIIAQAAVVFARPAAEFAEMDVRLLGKLIESATAEMMPKKAEGDPEKNVPTPAVVN
jgi:acetyl-CoA carboxylase carboxyltransferase component